MLITEMSKVNRIITYNWVLDLRFGQSGWHGQFWRNPLYSIKIKENTGCLCKLEIWGIPIVLANEGNWKWGVKPRGVRAQNLTILRIIGILVAPLVDLRNGPQHSGAPVKSGPRSEVLVVLRVLRVAVLGRHVVGESGEGARSADSDEGGEDDLWTMMNM